VWTCFVVLVLVISDGFMLQIPAELDAIQAAVTSWRCEQSCSVEYIVRIVADFDVIVA